MSDPNALLNQADRALAGASGFSLFGGKTEKLENAVELYTQAANSFRMQKLNRPAGQAFESAANIQFSRLNEPDDGANTLVEAYKVYKKSDPSDAARCLTVSINHYTSKGNFRRGATHMQNLAETYEEMGEDKKAMESYETAASWFESDNAEALANKLYLKVADLAALSGDYYKAIENFEKVAKSAVSNNLMKWSLKDYFLKSGLCLLAVGDSVAFRNALVKYNEMDPTFDGTRECQLLKDLAPPVFTPREVDSPQDVFADKLFQYDQMSKLDKWKTTLLLRIKNAIEDTADDFS